MLRKMDELFLLLTRGLPGCGKTTLAELLGLPFGERFGDQVVEGGGLHSGRRDGPSLSDRRGNKAIN